MSRSSRHEEITLRDRASSRDFVVRIPSTDIDACVHVTLLVALLTTVSILLAVTDIPRTGLTFRIGDHERPLSPGVAMFFGPYDYPVSHLHVNPESIPVKVSGSCEGEEVETLEMWSYKQDTMSIAPRAIAEYLNVTAYPACVLYKERCQSSSLDVTTVFMMLDGLIDAIHNKLFRNAAFDSFPFEFATTSYWMDRLHNYFVLTFTQTTDIRFHKVYHWSPTSDSSARIDPRNLCANEYGPVSEAKPAFCNDPIPWMCVHPASSSNGRMLPIWQHISLRFDNLKERYPDVELDFTMFISSMVEKSHSDIPVLRSVTITTDAMEVTTLIRGQECNAQGVCRTIFIDDYRYERGVIESNERDSALYVAILRGMAQLYIWIRVIFLAGGCYIARSREPKHLTRSMLERLVTTASTMVKIPGHVVLYGSWPPLAGYTVAHFCDSALVQSLGEFEWTSLKGLFRFNIVDYVLAASVQMRNIWLIVLVWKVVFMVLRRPTDGESISSYLRHHGILALRGGWIGTISWLTTFGMMRTLNFRNTHVIGINVLARHTVVPTVHTQLNSNDYGLQFDIKCSFVAFCLVAIVGSLLQLLLHRITGQETSLFVCRSFYVPYSAGTLWSWSALDIFWPIQFRPTSPGSVIRISVTSKLGPLFPSFKRPTSSQMSVQPMPSLPRPRVLSCRLCNVRSSMTNWPGVQGCPQHEPIYDVHRRTKALWSVVRLMNIANMTDPIALFRLYVTGRLLYLYRISSSNQPPYTILLPTAMERSDVTRKTRKISVRWQISRLDGGKDSDATFELLQIVDSRDVPWHVLVNCG